MLHRPQIVLPLHWTGLRLPDLDATAEEEESCAGQPHKLRLRLQHFLPPGGLISLLHEFTVDVSLGHGPVFRPGAFPDQRAGRPADDGRDERSPGEAAREASHLRDTGALDAVAATQLPALTHTAEC